MVAAILPSKVPGYFIHILVKVYDLHKHKFLYAIITKMLMAGGEFCCFNSFIAGKKTILFVGMIVAISKSRYF